MAAAALTFVCHGLALRGWGRWPTGPIASAIGAAVALVGLFTLYPLSRLLVQALSPPDGHASLRVFDRAYRIEPDLGLLAQWCGTPCNSV